MQQSVVRKHGICDEEMEERATHCGKLHANFSHDYDKFCPRIGACMEAGVFEFYSTQENYCPPVFDAELCWAAQKNGTVVQQSCPTGLAYRPNEVATRECLPNGTWLKIHDDSIFGGCDGATDLHRCFTQEFIHNYLMFHKNKNHTDSKVLRQMQSRYIPVIEICCNSASAIAIVATFYLLVTLKKSVGGASKKVNRNNYPLLISALLYSLIRFLLFVERYVRYRLRGTPSTTSTVFITDYLIVCNISLGLLEYFRLLLRVWLVHHLLSCFYEYRDLVAMRTAEPLVQFSNCRCRDSIPVESDENVNNLILIHYRERQRNNHWFSLFRRRSFLCWLLPAPTIMGWTGLKYLMRPRIEPCWLSYLREDSYWIVNISEICCHIAAISVLFRCLYLTREQLLAQDKSCVRKMVAKHAVVITVYLLEFSISQSPEHGALELQVAQNVAYHVLSGLQGLAIATTYYLCDSAPYLLLKREVERCRMRIQRYLPAVLTKKQQNGLGCACVMEDALTGDLASSTYSRDRDSSLRTSAVWYPTRSSGSQEIPLTRR